jgi:SAM-dependent methyltransferase
VKPNASKELWPTAKSEAGDRRRRTPEWLCYDLASRFAAGKRVLDCASATGYGAWLLASRGAAQVIGVDEDPEAVAYAQKQFVRPGLSFRLGDSRLLPLGSGEVELATSFETLERLRDAPAFIEELHRVLAPGGFLLLSTPLGHGEARLHPQDPLHVREYDGVELASLFAPRFSIAERYGLYSQGDLRARTEGLGPLLRSGAHQLFPERVRALGRRLLDRAEPDATLVEAGWEEAPVQLALARRVG